MELLQILVSQSITCHIHYKEDVIGLESYQKKVQFNFFSGLGLLCVCCYSVLLSSFYSFYHLLLFFQLSSLLGFGQMHDRRL